MLCVHSGPVGYARSSLFRLFAILEASRAWTFLLARYVGAVSYNIRCIEIWYDILVLLRMRYNRCTISLRSSWRSLSVGERDDRHQCSGGGLSRDERGTRRSVDQTSLSLFSSVYVPFDYDFEQQEVFP